MYGMGHGRVGGAEMQEASAFYDVSREPPKTELTGRCLISAHSCRFAAASTVFVAVVANDEDGDFRICFPNILLGFYLLSF